MDIIQCNLLVKTKRKVNVVIICHQETTNERIYSLMYALTLILLQWKSRWVVLRRVNPGSGMYKQTLLSKCKRSLEIKIHR